MFSPYIARASCAATCHRNRRQFFHFLPNAKNSNVSKSSPNRLNFCTRGFSGMGSMNPKEFLHFDRRKGPNRNFFKLRKFTHV
jgi:hypothetical protein